MYVRKGYLMDIQDIIQYLTVGGLLIRSLMVLTSMDKNIAILAGKAESTQKQVDAHEKQLDDHETRISHIEGAHCKTRRG